MTQLKVGDSFVSRSTTFVFLTGAPRSGTKILRDTIKTHPSVTATEHNLNSLWQTERTPDRHEEYSPDDLGPGDREMIRERLLKFFSSGEIFLEKNVSHSLRMEFVTEVLPDARFIHIYRDGRDAICSIRERWKNPTEWKYFLSRKLFELPYSRMPGFVFKQLKKHLGRLLGGESHVKTWGPVFKGMRRMVRQKDLLEVCLEQWKRCIRSILEFQQRHPEKVFSVRYENLMEPSRHVLPEVADFLGFEDASELVGFSERYYHTDSIGRWKNELSVQELNRVQAGIESEMTRLGYSLD